MASANLENQQASGAAMQNQIMAAKLPMMLDAYKRAQDHITDFNGQNGGQRPSALSYDASGVNNGAPPGANANIRVTPYDLLGRTPDQGNAVQGAVQGKYNVDPAGTPQEQQRIEAAQSFLSAQSLLGDKGLTDSASAQLDAAKYDRDMGVKSRVNASNLDASKYYETLSTVNDAEHPFEALRAVSPEAAARIRSANPNASTQDLDQAAEVEVGHAGAFIHRFTGRETVKGEDNIYRDKDTQQPVMGVVPAGFKPDEIAKMQEDGNSQVTVKRNGVDTSMKKYEAAGYKNIDQYVQAMTAQARSAQASQAKVEQRRQSAVQIQAQAGVPVNARIPAPGQKLPASAVAAAAAQSQSTPPAPRPAPLSPNNGGKQLDFSDAPKAPVPDMQGKNSAYSPEGQAESEGYGKEVMAASTTAADHLSGANVAIQGARNAQIALDSGSATGATHAFRQTVATILNNPKALQWALGNASASAVLTKVLGNNAIMAIQTEAQQGGSQMRLGQNTIAMAMNKLAASPEMTTDAIRAMTDSLIKNAQYDRTKWGQDFQAYSQSGGKVDKRADAYSAWYDNKYPNTSVINADTLNGKPDGAETRSYKGTNYYLKPGADRSKKENWVAH
jgi:hypothetical protein